MNRLPQLIANDGMWNVIINRLSRMFLRKNRLQKLSARRLITFFASLCGLCKLEMLKFSGKLNHFALKAEIYISAIAYRLCGAAKITAFENYCVTLSFNFFIITIL